MNVCVEERGVRVFFFFLKVYELTTFPPVSLLHEMPS